MEITNEEIVNEAMGNHDKHYWALVQTLKGRRKGWAELADLIGEGSTVAKAIWDKYLDFDFNKPLAGSPAPTPPLDVEARELEEAWSMLVERGVRIYTLSTALIDRDAYARTERAITQLLSLLRRHIASPAQPEKRDEWVSVDERLPEDSEIVLLFQRDGIASVTTFGVRDNGAWLDYNNTTDDYANEIRKITHWQPLPAPPQSGKEGQ